MMLSSDYLIPIMNKELRRGITRFDVYEGWRSDRPIFSGFYERRAFRVRSISKDDYFSRFPRDRDFPCYFDLIQKVLHGSCILDLSEIEEFRNRFREITEDEEPFRRNTRFYYDTNSLMNNYFHIFRETIPDFTTAAGHTTSYGVVSELEDLFDRKLKGRFFPGSFDEIYSGNGDMFYNQPNLSGRFARMGYPEIDYMKDELQADILTDDRTGDRGIMSAFVRDANQNNVEGVIVTNDATMAERAGKRMGAWHVNFDLERVYDVRTKMEYFLDALYRASVTYGRIKVNDNIVIEGIWKGKDAEEWKGRCVRISKCNDCKIESISRILERVPDEFFGKGYYS
ncbi:MAG: hypothetical protein R6V01_10600 [Thermoplasmatota archaeon]